MAATETGVGADRELIANGDFQAHDEHGALAKWQVWQPGWGPAACRVFAGPKGLACRAPDNPYACGGVEQVVEGVVGGQAYCVSVDCQVTDLVAPYQSLLVRVLWSRDGRPLHPAGRLVRGPVVTEKEGRFEDVLVAPAEADGALVRLEARWLGRGAVRWQRVSMLPTAAPPDRKVKVGTVYLTPRQSTLPRNLELWEEQLDAAGKLGLDIVCLGESIVGVGTGLTPGQRAAPLPGPLSTRLGGAAKRNNLWVVAGLTELDGSTLYNTAVLLNRQGELAGTYRKVHLPREEWRQGVTPGHEYPVFDVEFGRIAIQICYDWFFPEAAAAFALQGAEILFAPTWGNTRADRDGRVDGESTFRVRARDNGLFLVPSVYSGNSLIIDPLGRILASSDGQEGVVWAEIDLNDREPLEWVGHWRSLGPRDRRPETYGRLTLPATGPTY